MIRMNPADLTNLLEDARRIGGSLSSSVARAEGDRAKAEAELAALRVEHGHLRHAFETAQGAAQQRANFPAVRAEQTRIVKTIRKVLPKKAASDLLFKLAMGDIGDLK